MEKNHITEEERLEGFLLKIDNLILKGLETDRYTSELDDLFGIRNFVLERLESLDKSYNKQLFWEDYKRKVRYKY